MHPNPYRILLVEDDDCTRLVVARALGRTLAERGTVHFVDCGERAIEYLAGHGVYANRAFHPFPTMLITDLNMPRGDGFAVLEFLQVNPAWSVNPKIVFTSSDDPDDVATAYLLGASAYHQKPCSADGLVSCIDRILAYWLSCCVPAVDLDGRIKPTRHDGKLGARYSFPNATPHMLSHGNSHGSPMTATPVRRPSA